MRSDPVASVRVVENRQTGLNDLPSDVIDLIANRLAPDGSWNPVNYAVRDQAALAMAGRATRNLACALARRVSATLKTADRGAIPRTRPVPPPHLTFPSGVTDSSPFADVRAAAREIGVIPARSRAETIARVASAIAERERIVAETVSMAESYTEFPPVPRNPVPPNMRSNIAETPRMTRKIARSEFGLTETDLRDVPALLVRNPVVRSGAPMRLYEVRDLCSASIAKYGSEHAARTRPDPGATATGESRTEKRDAESEKVRALVVSNTPTPIESRAWSEVADQNRTSPRVLSRREMTRRWKAEIALANLTNRDRDLLMLGRCRSAHGAPSAEDHATLLEVRSRRDDVVGTWGGLRAMTFWSMIAGDDGDDGDADEPVHANPIVCAMTFERLRTKHRRFSALCERMDSRGVAVREDSRLCRSYVNGSGDDTDSVLDDVVDVMEEMAWLFANSELRYAEISNRLMDEAMDDLRSDRREWGERYGHEDVLEARDKSSETAKRRVCRFLKDNPIVRERVSPIPRLTRLRIEQIEDRARKAEVAAEQRRLNAMRHQENASLACLPSTLLETCFESLTLVKFKSLQPVVAERLFTSWFGRRVAFAGAGSEWDTDPVLVAVRDSAFRSGLEGSHRPVPIPDIRTFPNWSPRIRCVGEWTGLVLDIPKPETKSKRQKRREKRNGSWTGNKSIPGDVTVAFKLADRPFMRPETWPRTIGHHSIW